MRDDKLRVAKNIFLGIENLGNFNKNLENLTLVMNERPDLSCFEIIQRFSCLKHLKTLDLAFSQYIPDNNIVLPFYTNLLELIPGIPNLNHFELKCWRTSMIYKNDVLGIEFEWQEFIWKNLLKVMKSLVNVKNINIFIKNADEPTKYHIPELIKAMPEYSWFQSFRFRAQSGFHLEFASQKSLKLRFASFSEYETEFTNSCFSAIETITTLEELNLELTGLSKPMEDKIKGVSKAIKTLKELNTLRLSMNYSSKLNDTEMKILAEGIENLNLKSFEMSIDDSSAKLTATGVEAISKCLHKMTGLKELIFSAKSSPKIADYAILGMLAGGISQWKSLENCVIYCYLGSSLKLKNLQFLVLNFMSCSRLSTEGMTNLKKIIDGLPNLKQLNLLFGESPSVTDPLIMELFKKPTKKSQLEEFSFSLTRNGKFGTQGVISLCEYLSGISTESLNYLSIDIRNPGKVDGSACESLFTKIYNFTSLKTLNLNLNGIKGVTDKEIISLGKILEEKMKGLEKASFYLAQCAGITDVGVKALNSGLKFLEKVEDLKIIFDDNTKITGTVVKELAGVCEGLKGLKNFNISFSKCGKVKEADMKGLRDLILKIAKENKSGDDGKMKSE